MPPCVHRLQFALSNAQCVNCPGLSQWQHPSLFVDAKSQCDLSHLSFKKIMLPFWSWYNFNGRLLFGSVSLCILTAGGEWRVAASDISGGVFKEGFKVNNAAVFTYMPSEVRVGARRGGAGGGQRWGNNRRWPPHPTYSKRRRGTTL